MTRAATAAFVLALLAVGGCTRASSQPTPPPVPTFVVVIATAGPPPVPTPGEQTIYVVRDGDTLSAIAAQFSVAEEAMLKQNPGIDPDRLFVGQELHVPLAQP